MDIIKAIKSGKNFRRKDGKDWFLPCLDSRDIDISDVTYNDILADDWEIEEKKITIGRTDFLEKYMYYAYCATPQDKDVGQSRGEMMWDYLVRKFCD